MKNLAIVLLAFGTMAVGAQEVQEFDGFRFGAALSVGTHPSIFENALDVSENLTALDSEFYGSMQTGWTLANVTFGGEVQFGYDNAILGVGFRRITMNRSVYTDDPTAEYSSESKREAAGQIGVSGKYILNGGRSGVYFGAKGSHTYVEWEAREEDTTIEKVRAYSTDLFGLLGFRFDYANDLMFLDIETSFSPFSRSYGIDFLVGVQTR